MATEKSTLLTNQETNPVVISNTRGVLKSAADTVEVADGANDDIALTGIRIPVEAKVRSVRIAADDLGTGTTMHVGLYKDNLDGTYTAVDADCFATSIDVATAAVGVTEIRFEVKDISTINAVAWSIAGLSARPAYGELVLGVSFPVGTTAAGTVTAIVDIIQ